MKPIISNRKVLAFLLIVVIYVSLSSNFAKSSNASSLLFIYSTDSLAADSYLGLLESNGYSTDLIEQSKITTEGINEYDLILVGSDTQNTWEDDDKIASIDGSNKIILGLGEGGYDFFGILSLAIGRGNGWHGSENSIFVMNSSHQVFTSPNLIKDETIMLYTSTGHVGIYLPEPSNDIVLLGRESEDLSHYPIVQEKDRYLLWGFTASPDSMTAIGKELFINTMFYLTGQQPMTESQSIDTTFSEKTSSASTITFPLFSIITMLIIIPIFRIKQYIDRFQFR